MRMTTMKKTRARTSHSGDRGNNIWMRSSCLTLTKVLSGDKKITFLAFAQKSGKEKEHKD